MNDWTATRSRGADIASKVAEVTLLFWILKIIATTLGETAGDALSMTLGLGYVTALIVTGVFLVAVLSAQISAQRYRVALFWLAIVATTTMGTEVSDMMDRTLGLGYVWGSILLVAGLLATLAVWYYRKRDLSIHRIVRTDTEVMFWIAVIFSNSLGTAFGDALVDVVGLSYIQGALVTVGVIGVVLALHYATRVNAIFLFWIAFIFTRPFGATFGDFLTKSVSQGGLELGRLQASAVALVLMSALLLLAGRPWRPRRLA
ncbi:COG4705 family protein [Salinisphaera sp. SWV1]|uniref:COG4705 family protein n=1 Tax=Salinisphaera sp. SWV1 TaxID=3454139 RepID=UPI003F860B93